MKIIVCTENRSLIKAFKAIDKSRTFDLETAAPGNVKQVLADNRESALVYLDASVFSTTQIRRFLKAPALEDNYRFGIIDGAGDIDDPATLFYQGAADYISKDLAKQGITVARLKQAVSYCDFSETLPEAPLKAALKDDWKLSGRSWAGVKSGEEYTFCFMYIEIDLIDEWKNKSGHRHLDEVKAAFQQHVNHFAEGLSGRIWMWMDLYGVILFPFDGKRCDPILEAMRLVLNRTIISAEQYEYTTTISYKIALHIGNTIYRSRGNTGTIISDSVNFLFHVGHQFAKPGNFYLTEPVSRFIPRSLEDCFLPAGTFEGIPIVRMRLPVTPT